MGMLQVDSEFDYDGNVCKVVSVNMDGTVLKSSLWGVLQMVNQKNGCNKY